jgi:hypothetical protein
MPMPESMSTAAVSEPRPLLAFAHIEKTGGMSMSNILRQNFGHRYVHVRTLFPESGYCFTARDLQAYQRMLPGLACFSGHSVMATQDLLSVPGMRGMTVLRDPVQRYISHYWYRKLIHRLPLTFESYMDSPFTDNFQTRKMTGQADPEQPPDIEQAKDTITSLFHVGLTEHFDECLVILQKKLAPAPFCPAYSRRNVNVQKPDSEELLARYHDRIHEQNRLDIELYAHAREVVLPRDRAAYGPTLCADIAALTERNQEPPGGRWQTLGFLLGKYGYINLTAAAVRLAKGKPAFGAY